jgi:phosphoesterase RecJ-like protein
VIQRAAQQIAEADDVLIICHVSPDGDAIGSLLGLGLALEQGKNRVVMACADPVPSSYRHLPSWEKIVHSYQGRGDAGYSGARPFDLVISLDCSDLDRLGKAYDAGLLAGVPILNVDHHTTNTSFGQVNWVEPSAAATSQMIVRLIQVLHIPLRPEIATCLLNGILTDTLGFRTSNTTPEVMETAIALMESGASLVGLTDRIFNHRPLAAIRMWAMALQELYLEGRILWSAITQVVRQSADYQENGDAGLVNFLNTANDADIAVVFSELPDGRVDVSMRAVPGYDVSQVAFQLGGGGHAQAAGCTVAGPLESARTQVLAMLHEAWNAQSQVRQ